MKIFILKILALLILLITTKACILNSEASNIIDTDESNKMTLIWYDEFSEDGLPDPSKWNYDTGDGCPHICGWGNNELQYYTQANKNNARIENGKLIIEAHRESTDTKEYTSARLTTKNKGEWKYGKLEIRAKLPSGKGTWPAIWMLPTENKYGGWPNSGEIDIMEHVGYNPDSIFGTVHTGSYNHMIGTQCSNSDFHPDAESTFKNYAIEWDENKIAWYIDGKQHYTFENKKLTNKEWPFDQDFHLILNLAVGGNWGGKNGVDQNIWPQRFEIDYVRVWQNQNS